MLSKMLRIFMDGCNVNWKFLNILHTEMANMKLHCSKLLLWFTRLLALQS